MGAWGYKTLESDQGQEFVQVTLEPVADEIEKALTKRGHLNDPEAIRGAAVLLMQIGYVLVYPPSGRRKDRRSGAERLADDLDLAITALQALLDRPDHYVDSFDDQATIRSEIKKQISQLRKRRMDLPVYPGTKTLADTIGINADGTIG